VKLIIISDLEVSITSCLCCEYYEKIASGRTIYSKYLKRNIVKFLNLLLILSDEYTGPIINKPYFMSKL
jgi:hypothetical protein